MHGIGRRTEQVTRGWYNADTERCSDSTLTMPVHTGSKPMAARVASALEPVVRQGFPKPFRGASTVYAIAFDMDVDQLRANYGDPYNNAYLEIRRVLQRNGFTWQQG